MQQNFSVLNNINYIIGDNTVLEEMAELPVLEPFSERVLAFLNDLSKKLMGYGRTYSDVATLGFWCRKASMLNEKANYQNLDRRLGKGIAFHVAPSNVPVNFAFSFVMGLLAGNANIVRIPSREFEQVEILLKHLDELLETQYQDLKSYVLMVRYGHEQEITDYFSKICDVRLIWGGNQTITEIRKSPLKAKATEINFVDRYSISIIHSDTYLVEGEQNKNQLIQKFYNDTYFSDQNACSSPSLIIWTGHQIKKAKDDFWFRVSKMAREKYELSPKQSVGKLHAFLKAAALMKIEKEQNRDEFVVRMKVTSLDTKTMDYKYHSGFFFEYDANDLEDILVVLSEKCQTITYFGYDSKIINEFIYSHRVKGVDRIVPIGQAMDFSLVWDGYDMILSLSRLVSCK